MKNYINLLFINISNKRQISYDLIIIKASLRIADLKKIRQNTFLLY